MIHTPCKVVIIISYINVKTEKNIMKMGYRKSDKFFTPKQVAVIAEYLGEP